MTTCTRHIAVEAPPATVLGFVSHVPNLPRWTRFFLHVDTPLPGGRYSVDSLVGRMETWTETQYDDRAGRCVIHSAWAGRREGAAVDVTATAYGSDVAFTVQAPPHADAALLEALAATVDSELATLRELLSSVVVTAGADQ